MGIASPPDGAVDLLVTNTGDNETFSDVFDSDSDSEGRKCTNSD